MSRCMVLSVCTPVYTPSDRSDPFDSMFEYYSASTGSKDNTTKPVNQRLPCLPTTQAALAMPT